jgi:hypothetical protein
MAAMHGGCEPRKPDSLVAFQGTTDEQVVIDHVISQTS